jgi:hypothetical protein
VYLEADRWRDQRRAWVHDFMHFFRLCLIHSFSTVYLFNTVHILNARAEITCLQNAFNCSLHVQTVVQLAQEGFATSCMRLSNLDYYSHSRII